MNTDLIIAELAKRQLARRHYSEYLAYSYGDSWIRTKMSAFLAARIQSLSRRIPAMRMTFSLSSVRRSTARA